LNTKKINNAQEKIMDVQSHQSQMMTDQPAADETQAEAMTLVPASPKKTPKLYAVVEVMKDGGINNLIVEAPTKKELHMKLEPVDGVTYNVLAIFRGRRLNVVQRVSFS
jgi:hypothetical protein